jgi:hypothetical protein
MNYYVKNQKLLITEANLSTQNGFSELNNEQIDFFSRNQNASVDEILNCQLRENSEPALDVVKREKCAMVDSIYDSPVRKPTCFNRGMNHTKYACTNVQLFFEKTNIFLFFYYLYM